MFVNKQCLLGCDHIDTLENILSCGGLQDCLPDRRSSITFHDVYSEDVLIQKDATNLFMEMLEMREILLEEARQQDRSCSNAFICKLVLFYNHNLMEYTD